jgi:hypothetical protein
MIVIKPITIKEASFKFLIPGKIKLKIVVNDFIIISFPTLIALVTTPELLVVTRGWRA